MINDIFPQNIAQEHMQLSPGFYRTRSDDVAIVRRVNGLEAVGAIKFDNILFITHWDTQGATIRVTCFNEAEINKRDHDIVERIHI